jgi:hypothetical protein
MTKKKTRKKSIHLIAEQCDHCQTIDTYCDKVLESDENCTYDEDEVTCRVCKSRIREMEKFVRRSKV